LINRLRERAQNFPAWHFGPAMVESAGDRRIS
jgi:hypothetical protein